MDLGAAGLREQPFRTHGRPLAVVPWASFRQGLEVLDGIRGTVNGLCLLQGPALSGKSTLIRQFADTLPEDYPTAVVDGRGLNNISLLENVLQQFGYGFEHSSPNELLAMLRVFALQQTASHDAPLLIIENVHALNPSALRMLAELAELNVRGSSALKIVLASDRPLRSLVEAPGMEILTRRRGHDFHLRPMNSAEATVYLHTKLRAAGSDVPEFVFPAAPAAELWRASGGWPGILDRLALLALAKAATLPVSIDQVEYPVLPRGTWLDADPGAATSASAEPSGPPMLYVSNAGELLEERVFDKPRLLLGRSEHNDIALQSRFVSRHHALLVRHGGSTFLMDLNSTNGTFVNSRRVSNHVLVHEDVITLGHHRIKFHDPHATQRGTLAGIEFADTVIMKSLEDMRRLLAQENTAILPAVTENLPTTGL